MKTILDLPDALVKQVKLRALQEGRKLKDAVADLLRNGQSLAQQVRYRILELSPLLQGAEFHLLHQRIRKIEDCLHLRIFLTPASLKSGFILTSLRSASREPVGNVARCR